MYINFVVYNLDIIPGSIIIAKSNDFIATIISKLYNKDILLCKYIIYNICIKYLNISKIIIKNIVMFLANE